MRKGVTKREPNSVVHALDLLLVMIAQLNAEFVWSFMKSSWPFALLSCRIGGIALVELKTRKQDVDQLW